MLYVMAERWPKAGRYRDVFERLKQIVLGRDATDENDKNIVLDPPDPSTTGLDTGVEPSVTTVPSETTASRLTRNALPIPDSDAIRNATRSAIPNVIRNLVREPFPLWEAENFNLNFEALMPQPAGHNENPWMENDVTFDQENTTTFDFTFSPSGFGQPSDYDFDPVAFNYSPSQIQGNEYGGILEGLADRWPGAHP
ncbi:hypothetical protein LTR84_012756 [Exophiala bonariae]|uniref:Uncharacterized protein n=1 Tax=Exophiala bonariae TaxID=1690606 RepID=A0AAV9NEW2_9EURO|nr:hypothetical protein LTR84_012756 [Exophiala bonariae]